MQIPILWRTGMLSVQDIPDALPSYSSYGVTFVAMLALAAACGILSLVVLWRRWAFLGEAIAHAGFGGAGTAWMLAALIPALDRSPVVGVCLAAFCLLTALAIGAVHYHEKVHSDTAIGAFLAGALAWGYLGQEFYVGAFHRAPVGFEALLFGQTELRNPLHAQLAVALLVLTLCVLGFWRRQILMYCLDRSLAQVSGVRTGAVHYMLIVLIAVTIMVAVPLVGSVLATALLILPGATAALITRRLDRTIVLAVAISLGGALCGLAIHRLLPRMPQGPIIVLSLFGLFLVTWLTTRRRS